MGLQVLLHWVKELGDSMGFSEKRQIPSRMEGRVGVRLNIALHLYHEEKCDTRPRRQGCNFPHIQPKKLQGSELYEASISGH